MGMPRAFRARSGVVSPPLTRPIPAPTSPSSASVVHFILAPVEVNPGRRRLGPAGGGIKCTTAGVCKFGLGFRVDDRRRWQARVLTRRRRVQTLQNNSKITGKTLHPIPYTLHPKLCRTTQRSRSVAAKCNEGATALSPKPETRNPKPETLP